MSPELSFFPARELCSVTLTGPDLATADAYATAALAMGAGARDWLTSLDGYDAALIDVRGGCWSSPGWYCDDGTGGTNDG
jgi:FAD:protein FMN transferase